MPRYSFVNTYTVLHTYSPAWRSRSGTFKPRAFAGGRDAAATYAQFSSPVGGRRVCLCTVQCAYACSAARGWVDYDLRLRGRPKVLHSVCLHSGQCVHLHGVQVIGLDVKHKQEGTARPRARPARDRSKNKETTTVNPTIPHAPREAPHDPSCSRTNVSGIFRSPSAAARAGNSQSGIATGTENSTHYRGSASTR